MKSCIVIGCTHVHIKLSIVCSYACIPTKAFWFACLPPNINTVASAPWVMNPSLLAQKSNTMIIPKLCFYTWPEPQPYSTGMLIHCTNKNKAVKERCDIYMYLIIHIPIIIPFSYIYYIYTHTPMIYFINQCSL